MHELDGGVSEQKEVTVRPEVILGQIVDEVEGIEACEQDEPWDTDQHQVAEPVEGVEHGLQAVLEQVLLVEVRQVLGQLFFELVLILLDIFLDFFLVVFKLLLDAFFNVLGLLFDLIDACFVSKTSVFLFFLLLGLFLSLTLLVLELFLESSDLLVDTFFCRHKCQLVLTKHGGKHDCCKFIISRRSQAHWLDQ